MPGEKTYLVLDEHGKPVEAQASLDHPATVTATSKPAWWSDAWGSIELAGNPPKATPPAQPATKINGANESGG
jgi:hypothetical protein